MKAEAITAGEIFTVKQIARYLQIDEHTVYKLARSGEIPSVKVSGQWRFKRSLIDRWLETGSFRNMKDGEVRVGS